jgi:hypothetical protein
MPNTSALIAVQRHTAASRSTSPSSREQQGTTGGLPAFILIKFNTSAQTPNFSASTGHVLPEGAGGVHASVKVRKRRLKARNRGRVAESLKAIV